MYLVVGLGNPGRRYATSRHNIGFMVVDELARRLGATPWKEGFLSLAAEARVDGRKLLLLKPQTYMNRSGEAVVRAASYFKLGPESVIVVHDDIDLPLGKIKVKAGGGSAGHKGVESIASCLGTDGFIRIRAGIGRPVEGRDVVDHVLSRFDKEEEPVAERLVDLAADAVEAVLRRGLAEAANAYSGRSVGATH